MPSAILIHPAVWPHIQRPKIWEAVFVDTLYLITVHERNRQADRQDYYGNAAL